MRWTWVLSFIVFVNASVAAATQVACPLRLKLGQMLMLNAPQKVTLSKKFKTRLRKNSVGGVWLTEENLRTFKHSSEVARFTSRLQQDMMVPLFIAVDQEGGRVQRLGTHLGFSEIPSPQRMGQSGTPEAVRALGRIVGKELRAVGVNWNFAPILDVGNGPGGKGHGPYGRAISDDPRKVAELASSFALGLQEGGVIATGKHFPGLGRTRGDSHAAPVFLDVDWESLSAKELIPFEVSTRAGIYSLMAGHIRVPKLTGQEPASLSDFLLTEVLRKRLRFLGVIVSDDLTMKALSEPIEQLALRAILAGNDVVLTRYGTEEKILSHLCNVLGQNGEQATRLKQRIEESHSRVMELKKKIGLIPVPG